MPNFKYTALDQNGVEKTGIITADSKIAAAEMIRAQGLLLRVIAGPVRITLLPKKQKDSKPKKEKKPGMFAQAMAQSGGGMPPAM